MENLASVVNEFDSHNFMGKNGFVWWYGVVEDRKDPLYIGRVRVRCIGWHTDDKDLIATEDLPWADVVQPITSAAMSGIGQSPTGPVEGTHVFGFFRDGREAQQPVVLGTVGGIPERIANNLKGFFDPRDLEQRKTDPFPPFYIDRPNNGQGANIFDHDDGEKELLVGLGKSSNEEVVEYVTDNDADKALVNFLDSSGEVRRSLQLFPSNPDENRMIFDDDGTVSYSLPSTNLLSSGKIQFTRNDTTHNFWADLNLKTHRITRQLHNSNQSLHGNFFNSELDTNLTNSIPNEDSIIDPIYPHNHVTYTESGHMIEMDDTVGKERLRIMHRSTSNMHYHPNGDRVDLTVGSLYNMVDSDYISHVIGNKIESIEGRLDVVVRGQRSGSKISRTTFENTDYEIRAKNSNNIKLTTEGDGKIIFKTSQFLMDGSGSGDAENKNFTFEKINLKTQDSANVFFANSGSFTIDSENVSMNTKSLTIDSVGSITSDTLRSEYITKFDTNIKSTGAPKINTMNIINVLGDTLIENKNPVSKIAINVGPEGLPTNFELDPSGLSLFAARNAVFTLATGNFEVSCALGNLDLFATKNAKMATALGSIEIKPIGLIEIKNKTQSLGTIMQELLTEIMALNVPTGTGPSGTPINTPKFTAIQTKLKGLFA